MTTFKEWLACNEEVTPDNQAVVVPRIISQIVQKIFFDAERKQVWMSYNLQYWKENEQELRRELQAAADKIAGEFFQQGMQLNDFMLYGKLWTVAQGLFQKRPWGRRHINYAMSQGKHPQEVEKRRPGVMAGAVRGPYKKREPVI